MFLSIIIPVYNTEKYISECLESCIRQDIASTDYEIICVNDGSKDNSGKILEEYSRQYSNITVINQENKGVVAARNVGMAAAKGDYIWFVDSDDMICPDILGKLKRLTEATPCDRVMVDSYAFTESLSPEETELLNSHLLKPNCRYWNSNVWSNIVRREHLKENGLYFKHPGAIVGQDVLFMFEFEQIEHTAIQGPEETAYLYRKRPGSAVTSKGTEADRKRFSSFSEIAKILRTYVEDKAKRTEKCAILFMKFLWEAIFIATGMSFGEMLGCLKRLHKNGLFPTRKLEECKQLKGPYHELKRTDLVARLSDICYINLHRPWAVLTMWLVRRIVAKISEIRHRSR